MENYLLNFPFSMVGQLASWVMEVWYLVLVGVLSTNFDMDLLREVAPLLKHLEFFLIPLVQVKNMQKNTVQVSMSS